MTRKAKRRRMITSIIEHIIGCGVILLVMYLIGAICALALRLAGVG